jgi:hypothetical protein
MSKKIRNVVNFIINLFDTFINTPQAKYIEIKGRSNNGDVIYMEISKSDPNDRYNRSTPVNGVYYIHCEDAGFNANLFTSEIIRNFHHENLDPNLEGDNLYYNETDINLKFRNKTELKLILNSMYNFNVTEIRTIDKTYKGDNLLLISLIPKLKDEAKWARLRRTAKVEGHPDNLKDEWNKVNELNKINNLYKFGKRTNSLKKDIIYLSK